MLLIMVSCSGQEPTKEPTETAPEDRIIGKEEPHSYGGWYCPDNFGFIPVDIRKFNEVPAIEDRLPTEAELRGNMSLIKVDTAAYPDARALAMDLPRVASIHSEQLGLAELIIVIQAIVVQEDTVVGYRFMNGGNGSARLRDVTFLSEDEVAAFGAQPFFYSETIVKASSADIWAALTNTEYFKQLGEQFDQQAFFSSAWDPRAEARLRLDTDGDKAVGYVGMVFGNCYLQIDHNRNGQHYSEKLLLIGNPEEKTTEFHFASGPYPKGFETENSRLQQWVEAVRKASEGG